MSSACCPVVSSPGLRGRVLVATWPSRQDSGPSTVASLPIFQDGGCRDSVLPGSLALTLRRGKGSRVWGLSFLPSSRDPSLHQLPRVCLCGDRPK